MEPASSLADADATDLLPGGPRYGLGVNLVTIDRWLTIGHGGRLLKAVSSTTASYRVNGDEGYVRVEAIRDDGARAWSQPFFLSWR